MQLLALGAFLPAGQALAVSALVRTSLNAPFGARCFLTGASDTLPMKKIKFVLMHLLALGAF